MPRRMPSCATPRTLGGPIAARAMIARMMGFPATRVVSMAGLVPDAAKPWGTSPREQIDWLAQAGARGLVLDGTRDGIRARQLDGSARRAIASLLRRLDLRFRGIDLWIPAADFADPGTSSRAIDAACGAIELCADLHRVCGESSIAPAVNLSLPRGEDASSGAHAARLAVIDAAARFGARIADFGPGSREGIVDPDSPLGAGVDPFALLNSGQDPVAILGSLKAPLHGARERTASVMARAARESNARFDALAYRAALSLRSVVTDAPDQPASAGPSLVLDPRNEEHPQQALLALWSSSEII